LADEESEQQHGHPVAEIVAGPLGPEQNDSPGSMATALQPRAPTEHDSDEQEDADERKKARDHARPPPW
jgi:antitoxin (DNA-binding transcriptional repressor) of toxin-antitoxin stability system